ncbi:hypothetical protein E1264_34920 [Actinomadura sp. KC216]|uniref:hypothetical protein n=1 Tax=Actinomadura sp. KC216 TaxID=2530370 RepID=UPI0010468316|nr:hypothetical protein [Actinomadura sp. KC216]TDB79838.1 hypothetical protein E1264_34920 [Actinomadura sp. KC216]
MGNVSNPTSGPPSDLDARLARLLKDFPEWSFRYELYVNLTPWEAARRPFRGPVRGCFAWIRAESEERLREMLAAAEEIEARRDAPAVSEAPVPGGCVR